MREKTFALRDREQKRAMALNSALAGWWVRAEAAGVLGPSERQVGLPMSQQTDTHQHPKIRLWSERSHYQAWLHDSRHRKLPLRFHSYKRQRL